MKEAHLHGMALDSARIRRNKLKIRFREEVLMEAEESRETEEKFRMTRKLYSRFERPYMSVRSSRLSSSPMQSIQPLAMVATRKSFLESQWQLLSKKKMRSYYARKS